MSYGMIRADFRKNEKFRVVEERRKCMEGKTQQGREWYCINKSENWAGHVGETLVFIMIYEHLLRHGPSC